MSQKICDNLRQFATIRDNLRQFATIRDNSRQFATIRDNLRQFVTIRDKLRQFATIGDTLQHLATILDNFATIYIILGHIVAHCDNLLHVQYIPAILFQSATYARLCDMLCQIFATVFNSFWQPLFSGLASATVKFSNFRNSELIDHTGTLANRCSSTLFI